MASELTETLLELIQRCIPTYEAAQILLFLSANRDRAFRPDEIAAGMWPVLVAAQNVERQTTLLAANGLVIEHDGAFRYDARPELEPSIRELARAYAERPVTLIRAFCYVN